jgi:hypothetical protein
MLDYIKYNSPQVLAPLTNLSGDRQGLHTVDVHVTGGKIDF